MLAYGAGRRPPRRRKALKLCVSLRRSISGVRNVMLKETDTSDPFFHVMRRGDREMQAEARVQVKRPAFVSRSSR